VSQSNPQTELGLAGSSWSKGKGRLDLPSSEAPDGEPGFGQHFTLAAPEQKLETVEAPLQLSELMSMQLPALPFKQLA
jgi:hypothetical protein